MLYELLCETLKGYLILRKVQFDYHYNSLRYTLSLGITDYLRCMKLQTEFAKLRTLWD